MITFIRVGVALLSIVAMSGQGLAQESKLPDGLRHVPPDALAFVHIRTGDFLKTPTGKALLQELQSNPGATKGLKEVEAMLGVKLTEVDTVTMLLLAPPGDRFFERDDWERRRMMQLEMEMMRRRELEHPRWQKEKMEFKKDDKPFDEKRPIEKESPVLFRQPEVAVEHQISATQHHDQFDDFGRPLFEPLTIVTASKDLDRKAILRRSVDFGNGGGFPDPRRFSGPAVVFLGDRTVMLGETWRIARYQELIAREPGPKHRPLDFALTLGAKPHFIVASGNVPAGLRSVFFGPDNARLLATLSPLMSTTMGFTLDLGTRLDVGVYSNAATDASAAIAHEALKSARVLAKLLVDQTREVPGSQLELKKQFVKALDGMAIDRKGNTIHARFGIDLPATFPAEFAKGFVVGILRGPARAHNSSNLKQIVLAMHNHHDAYKHLPAAAISSRKNADGKPLLSWRVAILPFIEQEPLYRSFDLDQPWDHPTNKKLIPLMAPVFVMPGVDAEPGMTHYRTLVGPDTMLNPINVNGWLKPRFTLGNLPDGTSNTIMIVEAKEPTIWTKPDDLPYDPKGPLPKFGVWDDGFHVAMDDGSVRFVRSTVSEQSLRYAIHCSDGFTAGPDFDR